MAQQTLPFIEGKFGWSLGESNWNLGMDENLAKFSFLFDRNLDGIVASLPAAVNGQAYFLTTDNRLYFAAGGIFYSSPTPKWFVVQLRTSGQYYQFNGVTLDAVSGFADIDTRLDAVELAVIASTAATNTLISNLADSTNQALGATLIGRSSVAVASIQDLVLADVTPDLKQLFVVAAFHPGAFALAAPYLGSGGGVFQWDGSRAKTAHNGGTIIDPNIVFPTDWTNSTQVTAWFTAAVSGAGCFVRVGDGDLDVVMFGAKSDWNGTTGTNNSPMIQKAIDVSSGGGFQTSVGVVTGGFVSITRTLRIWRGAYKLDATLNCPAYFKVVAENSVLHQTNTGNDIFSGLSAYQWEISGVHFSGGRHHAILQNANTDVTRWSFTHCTFSLSSDFSVKTFPTGGATSHLSANLSIKQCAFYKPRKVLLNYCDSAIIEDCWVFVSKDNFTASTPVFENGSLTTDGYPNLYLNNMFGIPAMGTQGVDRLSNVRWCTLFKGAIIAKGSRFGGEFGGMPVVYNLATPVTTYPYRGPAVCLDNCEIFAGPSAAIDSGVISLQGQLPQRVEITNCAGPIEVPYITNAGAQIANFATYLTAFETASSQPSYTQFFIKIQNNSSYAPNGTVYGERVPAGIRHLCNNFRQTKIRRTTTQVLATAFASNIVSFGTLDYDSQGGFAAANPTRIVMPAGATKLRVQVYFTLDGAWTAGTLRAAIVTSGLAIVAGQGWASNNNADNQQYTFSVDLDGAPGTYWHLEIKHNATLAQNLTGATVTTTALDYIN